MTHGRMQTMTQGTQSISMAHRAALGCLAVARQLSVVVVMVSIIALVAGTAGTSYAKKKTPEDRSTEDTVVVTNFGSLFAGSVETFAAGSVLNSGPIRQIRGSNTLIGAGNGARPTPDFTAKRTLGMLLLRPERRLVALWIAASVQP